MTGGSWARLFLSVKLNGKVPPEVRDLFAAARGALVYGWFFYPLLAIGEQQLHRVADAAIAHRYRALGGPLTRGGRLPSLARRIRWLIAEGVIPEEMARRWDAIRELRNIGSHPEFQMLHLPGDALESLAIVADSVDALFVTRPR